MGGIVPRGIGSGNAPPGARSVRGAAAAGGPGHGGVEPPGPLALTSSLVSFGDSGRVAGTFRPGSQVA